MACVKLISSPSKKSRTEAGEIRGDVSHRANDVKEEHEWLARLHVGLHYLPILSDHAQEDRFCVSGGFHGKQAKLNPWSAACVHGRCSKRLTRGVVIRSERRLTTSRRDTRERGGASVVKLVEP